MRQRQLLLIANSIVLMCCCTVSSQDDRHDEKDWQLELERGYTTGSQAPLDAFLDAWIAASTPTPSRVLKKKPHFEQHVYGIFQSFYSPDIADVVVIQNEVKVDIVDSTLREEFTAEPRNRHEKRMASLNVVSSLVVRDFRPSQPFFPERIRLLYLDRKHLGYLVGFITHEANPGRLLRGNQYKWEPNGDNERRRRLEYLKARLRVLRGHWEIGWIFETEPTVTCIYLSSNMRRAIVLYQQRNGFGEALLERVGEYDWELLTKRITAIQ